MMGTQEADIAGGRKAVCADQGGNGRLFSDGAGADEPQDPRPGGCRGSSLP